jgi:hypothetical protein
MRNNLVPIQITEPLIVGGKNGLASRVNMLFLRREQARIARKPDGGEPEVIINEKGDRAHLIRWVSPAELKQVRDGASLYAFRHPDAKRLIKRRAQLKEVSDV